ncbi:Chaperone protein DnaK [Diplonema papillatum]|nr:Chaperone protein DnaK [Diplonema papillatum]
MAVGDMAGDRVHIGLDLGCQSCKVLTTEKKTASAYANLICWVDQFLVERSAAKELETRHQNIVQHLTANLHTNRDLVLSHARYGDQEVTVEFCLALLLQRLASKAVNDKNKTELPANATCTVSVHPGLTAVEIERIRLAADVAGLTNVQFIPSTVATALHFLQQPGMEAAIGSKVLVVDAGCRYTSASVIELAGGGVVVVYLTESIKMGGHDIDKSILQTTGAADVDLHPITLHGAVERAKRDLSSLQATDIHLPGRSIPLTREGLEECASEYLNKLQAMASRMTAEYPDVSSVLLVGGTGRMPAVQGLLKECCPDRELPLERVDFDFSSVQGCLAYRSDEQASLRDGAAAPFRFWATDESGEQVWRMPFIGGSDSLPKDAHFIYQELIDPALPPDTVPTAALFEEGRTYLLEQPPLLVPKDGVLPSNAPRVAAVYDVSKAPEGVGLRVTTAGQPVASHKAHGLRELVAIDSAAKLKERVREANEHTAKLVKIAEARNSLEEAFLRYEADDYPEKIDAKYPQLKALVEQATEWTEKQLVVDLDDMSSMTNLINMLMDAYEGEPLDAAKVETLEAHIADEPTRRKRRLDEEDSRKRRKKESEEAAKRVAIELDKEKAARAAAAKAEEADRKAAELLAKEEQQQAAKKEQEAIQKLQQAKAAREAAERLLQQKQQQQQEEEAARQQAEKQRLNPAEQQRPKAEPLRGSPESRVEDAHRARDAADTLQLSSSTAASMVSQEPDHDENTVESMDQDRPPALPKPPSSHAIPFAFAVVIPVVAVGIYLLNLHFDWF